MDVRVDVRVEKAIQEEEFRDKNGDMLVNFMICWNDFGYLRALLEKGLGECFGGTIMGF